MKDLDLPQENVLPQTILEQVKQGREGLAHCDADLFLVLHVAVTSYNINDPSDVSCMRML